MNLLKEQNKNMLYPNYTARLANLTFKYITHRRKSFESIRLFCSVEHVWEIWGAGFILIGILKYIWNQFITTLHLKKKEREKKRDSAF